MALGIDIEGEEEALLGNPSGLEKDTAEIFVGGKAIVGFVAPKKK